jgi:phosphate transport system protein
MQHFYESELNAICDKLLLMGRRSVELTRSAMQALEERDDDRARAVLKADDEIDALEKEIDNACVRYISLRGPVASDVRLLTLAMKACHDLERIGDEACSIAKRVAKNGGPDRKSVV